jgi:hypothetical protein
MFSGHFGMTLFFFFFFKIPCSIPFKDKVTKLFQILNTYVSISAASRLFQVSLDVNLMTLNY